MVELCTVLNAGQSWGRGVCGGWQAESGKVAGRGIRGNLEGPDAPTMTRQLRGVRTGPGLPPAILCCHPPPPDPVPSLEGTSPATGSPASAHLTHLPGVLSWRGRRLRSSPGGWEVVGLESR